MSRNRKAVERSSDARSATRLRMNGGHRRALMTVLGGSVLWIVVMFLVPTVTAAAPTTSTKTYTAPFTGSPLTFRDLISEACGTASLTHGPAFNFSSGVGRVQANTSATSAPSCRSPVIESVGEAAGWFGLTTVNFTHISGVHKLRAVWDLHWTTELKASGAGSHPGNLQTGVAIEVIVEIVDLTKNNAVADHEWEKVLNRTGDTSVVSVGNQMQSLSVNGTFNASHVYAFLTVVEFTALSSVVQGATSGQARASLNFATSGNKATLESITRP
jgi:hypothetical protein